MRPRLVSTRQYAGPGGCRDTTVLAGFANIAGWPTPKRTLCGRYEYGDLDDVTVDVLLDRMEDAVNLSRAVRNDWTVLSMISPRGWEE